MENNQNQSQQQVVKSIPNQRSMQLITSIIKLEVNKLEAKMELMDFSSQLMPDGKPNFLAIVSYPMIRSLVQEQSRKTMHKVIFLLIKDFCASMNVVRNMNEDQMIEAAGMLIDECGNFRLEDYVMMFQMAKRGQLFDIHDRVDLQVITRMLDRYWQIRHEAGESHVENEINHIDTLGNIQRVFDKKQVFNPKTGNYETVPSDLERVESLAGMFGSLKGLIKEKMGGEEEIAKLKQIEKDDTEAIRKQLKERGYATD